MSATTFSDLVHRHLNLAEIHIGTIYDVGARDCADTLALAELFPRTKLVAFEPNPATIGTCMAKAAPLGHRISVLNVALSNFAGPTTYYQSQTANTGCSSLFEPSPEYEPIEHMVMEKISVPVCQLEPMIFTGVITPPDLMWLDCQGSELNVLKGLRHHLDNVHGIWLEVLHGPIYKDAPRAEDLDKFLVKNGFTRVHYQTGHIKDGFAWFGDACYIRLPA